MYSSSLNFNFLINEMDIYISSHKGLLLKINEIESIKPPATGDSQKVINPPPHWPLSTHLKSYRPHSVDDGLIFIITKPRKLGQ